MSGDAHPGGYHVKKLLLVAVAALLTAIGAPAVNATAATPLAVATASLPNSYINETYNLALQAAGGTAPYSWSITSGALPTGLALNPAGVISGGAQSAGVGAWSVTVNVTDAQEQTAAKTYSINSAVRLNPELTGLVATTGQPYARWADPRGGFGPYRWSLIGGGLPRGITFSTDGVISGTPTATVLEDWVATMRLSDGSAQNMVVPLSFRIWPGETGTTISTTSVPNGRVGQAYSAALAVKSPAPTLTGWKVFNGALPWGLTVGDNGVISGIPTDTGAWNVTLGAYEAATSRTFLSNPLTVTIEAATTTTPVVPSGPLAVARQANGRVSAMFVGDSLTAGFFASTLAASFPSLVSATIGQVDQVQASRANQTLSTVNGITNVPAGLQLAVIELGTNDVGIPTDLTAFRASYDGLLGKVRASSPAAAILCLGVWTAWGPTYDDQISQSCAHNGGKFVALSSLYAVDANHGPAGVTTFNGLSDTFHPNDTGHAAIANLIMSSIVVAPKIGG
ncbi:MAG: lysophospholipase [Pseudonocardiales bacterium]|nr:lysophospholipase [Pseudonocardiales bacterium]